MFRFLYISSVISFASIFTLFAWREWAGKRACETVFHYFKHIHPTITEQESFLYAYKTTIFLWRGISRLLVQFCEWNEAQIIVNSRKIAVHSAYQFENYRWKENNTERERGEETRVEGEK